MALIHEPRLILHVSLGGGNEHRLGTLIGLAVALEKGYYIEDNAAWRGGHAIPDGVIYKPGSKPHSPPQVRYWLETLWLHDPRKEWHLRGYNVQDVLVGDLGECLDAEGNLDLDMVYALWQKVIP